MHFEVQPTIVGGQCSGLSSTGVVERHSTLEPISVRDSLLARDDGARVSIAGVLYSKDVTACGLEDGTLIWTIV